MHPVNISVRTIPVRTGNGENLAQPRVHEFAKEVGVPSKEVIAKLKDMGEFVKSSSSTLNPHGSEEAARGIPRRSR